MRPKPYLTFLLLLYLTSAANAQETKPPGPRAMAQQHILALKNGALLVRLQSRSNSLQKLRDRGMNENAAELEAEIHAENLEYTEAFSRNFDFAPVYFFRSEDSGAIRERRLDDVIFLDDEMVPDSSIRVTEKSIYIAEFDKVKPDDSKYVDGYRVEKDSTGLTQKKKYYGSTDMGFEAVVIMNDQFVQLRKPFPYYVRTFDKKGILSRKPGVAVKKLNQKLFEFY